MNDVVNFIITILVIAADLAVVMVVVGILALISILFDRCEEAFKEWRKKQPAKSVTPKTNSSNVLYTYAWSLLQSNSTMKRKDLFLSYIKT